VPLFFAVGSFAEFSLGAEITTVALTVKINSIEKVRGEGAS
jgi:hypothetical protein